MEAEIDGLTKAQDELVLDIIAFLGDVQSICQKCTGSDVASTAELMQLLDNARELEARAMSQFVEFDK